MRLQVSAEDGLDVDAASLKRKDISPHATAERTMRHQDPFLLKLHAMDSALDGVALICYHDGAQGRVVGMKLGGRVGEVVLDQQLFGMSTLNG